MTLDKILPGPVAALDGGSNFGEWTWPALCLVTLILQCNFVSAIHKRRYRKEGNSRWKGTSWFICELVLLTSLLSMI